MRKNKYGNKKTELDGITFDSAKEARRYAELKMLEKMGLIQDLKLQVDFVLQPKFRSEFTGKVIREIKYVADFTYVKDDKLVIEDVKSAITRQDKVYRLKRKMMEYKGYQIHEV